MGDPDREVPQDPWEPVPWRITILTGWQPLTGQHPHAHATHATADAHRVLSLRSWANAPGPSPREVPSLVGKRNKPVHRV